MNLYELSAILRLDSSQFEAGLSESEKKAGSFGQKLGSGLTKAAKVGGIALAAAGTAAAAFSVSAIKDSAAFADEINTLSKVTGMSTEALQEYTYAADLLDVSVDTISGSLAKLTRNMDSAKSGTGEAAEAFAALGIDVVDANGNLRDSNDVFDEAIEALGHIENETERDAAAMAIFGRSARELNPLIETGADALNGLRDEAHKVGAVLDGETLDTLNSVQDGFDRLKGAWGSLKKQLGAKIGKAVLPDLEKLVGLFQDLASTGDFGSFVDGIGDMINDLVEEIPKFTEKIIQAIPKVIKSLTKALTKLLPNLAKSIGEILGQLFANLPELISAGLELGWALVKGVVMAIPNMISGIVDALTGRKLSEAAQACKNQFESIKKSIEDLPTATERIASALDDVSVKFEEADYWVKVFENLEKKTNPTAADLELMNKAAGKLNELFPELGLQIEEDTGKWNLNAAAIRKTIKALKDRYEAEAYFEAASEARKEAKRTEAEMRGLNSQAEELQTRLLGAIEARDALYAEVEAGNRPIFDPELALASAEVNDLQDQLGIVNQSMVALDKSIVQLNDDADYLQAQGMARLTEAVRNENKAVREATHTMLAEGKKLGENYTLGIVEGLDAKRSVLFDRARKLMKDTVNVMMDAGQIHSPSKLTENLIGKNLALGVVKGWNDVMNGGIGRRSFSLGSAVDSVRRNSTVNNTANYGGVSVNVYARDGQSEEAIANMVMVRMQSAVDARKAVFA